MKYLLLLLCWSGLTAQRITGSEAAIKELLCRSWKYEYAYSNGQKIASDLDRRLVLTFYADYTFTTESKNGSIQKGTWCYNSEKKNIELSNEFGSTTRIFELLADSLIIVLANDIRKNTITVPHSYSKYSRTH